jgi:hypothetical protein
MGKLPFNDIIGLQIMLELGLDYVLINRSKGQLRESKKIICTTRLQLYVSVLLRF